MLNFADFSKYYKGSGLSDSQQREHFATISDILECVVRYFYWNDGTGAKLLGIAFNECDGSSANGVESTSPMKASFNEKTTEVAKKETDEN